MATYRRSYERAEVSGLRKHICMYSEVCQKHHHVYSIYLRGFSIQSGATVSTTRIWVNNKKKNVKEKNELPFAELLSFLLALGHKTRKIQQRAASGQVRIVRTRVRMGRRALRERA